MTVKNQSLIRHNSMAIIFARWKKNFASNKEKLNVQIIFKAVNKLIKKKLSPCLIILNLKMF